MFFFLLNFIFIWNFVASNEIESSNEKSNITEENCQDGTCKEIIDVNYTIENSNLEISSSEDVPMFASVEETFYPSCPENLSCGELPAECISCQFDFSCIYGHELNVSCKAKPTVKCTGPRHFERSMTCQYCYQTPSEKHTCSKIGHCNSAANPVQRYRSNCTVKSNILCLGKRNFPKNVRCNWTSGYRWSTTLFLSITLGGFGADRFYLGHWQEGIGKLFSFGGAGVWTLIDVILVAVGYLKPADGSLYI